MHFFTIPDEPSTSGQATGRRSKDLDFARNWKELFPRWRRHMPLCPLFAWPVSCHNTILSSSIFPDAATKMFNLLQICSRNESDMRHVFGAEARRARRVHPVSLGGGVPGLIDRSNFCMYLLGWWPGASAAGCVLLSGLPTEP